MSWAEAPPRLTARATAAIALFMRIFIAVVSFGLKMLCQRSLAVPVLKITVALSGDGALQIVASTCAMGAFGPISAV